MKKLINKIKKGCRNFATGKFGFSLVELIVVIAIMAVMAAVLAPALLGYVEKSRMQKDSSAMGEVTNAIQLSLADQNVYDELLPYTVKDNFSCYADGDTITNIAANQVVTKEPNYWYYNDNARLLDEVAYKPAGSMRGVTITLKPNGSAEYILKDGIINQTGDSSTVKGTITGKTLNDAPEVYNRLRSTVGDTIKVSSQTYRNSTYTIFISMGTTGGNQADKQDAIQVYGQYNGTNLPEVMTATGNATQDKGNTNNDESGSEIPTLTELTTVKQKTWTGLTYFRGYDIWTDGTNTYRSVANQHYILNGDNWQSSTTNMTSFSGDDVWSDGTNFYYTSLGRSYVLDNGTWVTKTWEGPYAPKYGNDIWTDGTNIYSSSFEEHYVLKNGKWEVKTWSGLNDFNGSCIWTDGTNIYYSARKITINGTFDETSCINQQYVLDGDTWRPKTWSGLNAFDGYYVWTDGANVYYSGLEMDGTTIHYVLKNGKWEPKSWDGPKDFNGFYIWTDGVNYYYSNETTHYVFS